MRIEFDAAKRDATLRERGLDMADAVRVFAASNVTFEDDRHDYGEPRWATFGLLDGRLVFVAWTPRGGSRRIISMRKCNEREQAEYLSRVAD